MELGAFCASKFKGRLGTTAIVIRAAGQPEVVAVSRETSPGAGKLYGLERVCRALEFPRSTIYARQARGSAKVVPLRTQRRGPKPRMSDADLFAAIRADLEASLFAGEGHRKVWPRLRILDGRVFRNVEEVRAAVTEFKDRSLAS